MGESVHGRDVKVKPGGKTRDSAEYAYSLKYFIKYFKKHLTKYIIDIIYILVS